MGYAAVGTLRGLWLGAGETIRLARLARLQHRRILAWLTQEAQRTHGTTAASTSSTAARGPLRFTDS